MKISKKSKILIAAFVCITLVVLFLILLPHNKSNPQVTQSQNQDLVQEENTTSSLLLDIDEKKIGIPERYISTITKDTYISQEEIQDSKLIAELIDDINSAEITKLYLGSELVDGERLFIEEREAILAYPLSLQTSCKDDFLKINTLVEHDDHFLTSLSFQIPTTNIKWSKASSMPSKDDDNYNIRCTLESKKLYEDVQKAWGRRITLDDIQNPESICVSYNPKNHLFTKDTAPVKFDFAQDDAIEFVEMLQKEAKPINDTHCYGFTFSIQTKENETIDLYFAEDGCEMFQLDGVSYELENTAGSAALAEKYINFLIRNNL